jgi:hypothetical protein
VDRVHGAVDRGRHRSTVDGGQGLGGSSLEDGRNSAPMRGTSPRLSKKGEGTTVSLTSCKRGGGGTETAGCRWGITGGGGTWCGWCTGAERREAGRGLMKPEVGPHPFIGAGEGHARARKGETASGNVLNAIEGRRLNEGLRGGNQGGE